MLEKSKRFFDTVKNKGRNNVSRGDVEQWKCNAPQPRMVILRKY